MIRHPPKIRVCFQCRFPSSTCVGIGQVSFNLHDRSQYESSYKLLNIDYCIFHRTDAGHYCSSEGCKDARCHQIPRYGLNHTKQGDISGACLKMWIYAGFLRLNFYLPFTDVPPAYSLRWESVIRAVRDTAIKVRCSHSIIPFDLYNLSPLRLSYVASHCFFFYPTVCPCLQS